MTGPVASLALAGAQLRDALFPPERATRLRELVSCDLDIVVTDFHDPRLDLSETEILLTGWGCPRIDEAALVRMPELRLIAHLAGTVKGHVDRACWARGIAVTTAAAANAVPVAEFTLAQILLANKSAPAATRHLLRHRDRSWSAVAPLVGNYERSVGVIGASTIGRLLLERLRPFALRTLLYDPT
ncbi:MAG TPA: hydroxyacid dehydrogenase, partial [Microlunatus sp.]|nr:hydroxyacid dehydrogenase [Microlunatus sp.]